MDMFKKVFNGDERLVITYWVWGVIGSIVWGILWGLILGFTGLLDPIILNIVVLIYSVFIWVAIWRSSDKYTGQKVWAILAKVAVVLGVLYTVYGFINPTPTPWT